MMSPCPLSALRATLPVTRARIGALRSADSGDLTRRAAHADAKVDDIVALGAEATRRVLGVELHDGQLLAGAAMCIGYGVQMLTGEGKTFASIIPALFHGRAGGGVHVVTANPYLAARDASWSGAVLESLGLSVGVTLPGMSRAATRAAYACDVTFGADREFGFDYLRDNLWLPGESPVQRGRAAAIVDEADAVLLDQARTPLVLSGSSLTTRDVIGRVDAVVRQLRVPEHVAVDPERHRCDLTDAGIARCEDLLGVPNLYADDTVDWPHRLSMGLRAHVVLQRDRDYIVSGGAICVVDEVTGRIADGRRWSDGLQQAVEAKEGLGIVDERRAFARITVGSYFLGYNHLIGMSGTLEGAEQELADTYGMQGVAIPPNRPVIRRDHPDVTFTDRSARDLAVASDVATRHQVGQPVLVATRSIAQSLAFARLLEDRDVPHRVLTARNDADEAAIIARAGQQGAVTVATQMAGRGVDIVLDEDARRAGGLMVWGLEHHPSRRHDMQLVGRSGRQGDPGESRFAACPDDEIAGIGQTLAEQLDAELRATVRHFDGAVDEAQQRLHAWREASANTPIEPQLTDAIATLATTLATTSRRQRPALAADIGLDLGHLPRRSTHRRREIDNRLQGMLERRATELGGTAAWAEVARVVLSQLLIVLWADQLDILESRKTLARISTPQAGDVSAWRVDVARSYQAFTATVTQEWITQLLHLRLGAIWSGSSSMEVPAAVEATAQPIDATEPPPEWTGWSYNRWVRNHFGLLVNWEPPVVLALDAVGDTTESPRAKVRLDLDDPRRSAVELRTDTPHGETT